MNLRIYMRLLRIFNPFKIHTQDRIILEERIMPRYFPGKGKKVLLVGFQKYNLHYLLFYFFRKVVICDSITRIKYLELFWKVFMGKIEDFPVEKNKDKFSLIHFYGVYGWGLDDRQSLIKAIRVMKLLLLPGGIIIFGHNMSDHNPLSMELEYKKYFSSLFEINDGICPIVDIKMNQVVRIFKKL